MKLFKIQSQKCSDIKTHTYVHIMYVYGVINVLVKLFSQDLPYFRSVLLALIIISFTLHKLLHNSAIH